MNIKDFSIGTRFRCGARTFQCTDIGTRVVVAIALDVEVCSNSVARRQLAEPEGRAAGWFSGPPYAVNEIVFDENDLPLCSTWMTTGGGEAEWTNPENDEPAEDVAIDSRALLAWPPVCLRCGQIAAAHSTDASTFLPVCPDHQPANSPLPYLGSFADAPPTIGELRAKREHSAAKWSPRDALVNLLREIDAGATKVSALVVTFAVEREDGSLGHGFRNAAPDNFTALGLLARASHRLQEE